MSSITKMLATLCVVILTLSVNAQHIIKGKIIDASTKEPIYGASIQCPDAGCTCGCATNHAGEFEMKCRGCKKLTVSYIGYMSKEIETNTSDQIIAMVTTNSLLNEVVISGNREAVRRSQAPVAITNINFKILQDAKPVSADQVLNKISGVNMVNLGNEQHQMSIRQPMTTKSLFLYLEDGIPIRTTGLFNHNALLEMNMAAVKNIEVIKGPSSSLYGSEAIGGIVNFISIAPTTIPIAKFSLQRNNIGYKRAELQSGFISGKWGFALSGYYADKSNSYIEYSDFHKAGLTARLDYRFSEKTNLSSSLTWIDYYSDMPGGIDSSKFAQKSFTNYHTFTYRKVNALRYRSTLTKNWSEHGKTTVSAVYRNNSIGQNPSYSVKDDFHPVSNSIWVGKKDLAHGEINESSFRSYALIFQHRQKLDWKKAMIVAGASIDLSPSSYNAEYIRIRRDSASKKYLSYETKDSLLTSYKNNINNYAAFLNFEFSPIEKLRVVASMRYDLFRYDFNNHLVSSAFSGAPDQINGFSTISPKIGFTYNFSERTGVYANYSEGFVPPQVTEMYRGVKIPDLDPSIFYNYEAGGWYELVANKLSADVSIYKLNGTNEIISVKLDDGSTENRNAGKTSHNGIEMGINASPLKDLTIRFAGAYSEHRFTRFIEKGNNYNGNEMNGAPHWMHNVEVWYKPGFARGLRLGIEWQKIGSYFMDQKNTTKYDGYNVFHLRAGYKVKGFEIWMNAMNVTDAYYAYLATKSSSGYSYTPAEPRNFNLGISYDFAQISKASKK